MNIIPSQYQMLKRPELEKLTGLSRSSIYDRLDHKSKRYDPTFPKPVKLGYATRWRLTEIQGWIESKASIRNQN